MLGNSVHRRSETLLPQPVTLLGRHIQLAPLIMEHAGDIYRQTHGEGRDALWAEMKVGPFAEADAFGVHVAELIADRSRTFLVVASLEGEPLGWVCLMEANPSHRVIELGYVLFAPPLQRTTAATEVFWLIMSHVFDDLNYARLEWTCTVENAKSRRAADRLGFTFEGIMRDKLIIKGVQRNICLYSMLASDWTKVSQALTAWLFGRQLRPRKSATIVA